MITAIAIDDEPMALEILEAFCSQNDQVELKKTFTKTADARRYLNTFPVDLMFLDINMPEITGIDFYKGLAHPTMVIFTTAFSQYAVDGFELSAVDFLLKPYSPERFTVAVQKAFEYHKFLANKQSGEEKHIFIRVEYSLVKIALADILYIEGLADYLKVHLVNNKMVITRMTMKSLLAKLSEKEFIRIHRSFIIPFSKIEGLRNKNVQLPGNIAIPIGASYEEAFLKAYQS